MSRFPAVWRLTDRGPHLSPNILRKERPMRHTWITLVVGAVVSAAPATLAAQATSTVERDYEFVQSFSDYNPCSNEPIVVSGAFKTTVRTTIDANGRSHEAETVLGRFNGIGATGAKYNIQFAEHLVDARS